MSGHNKTQRDHHITIASLKSNESCISSNQTDSETSSYRKPQRQSRRCISEIPWRPKPGGEAQSQCRHHHHQTSTPFPGVGRSFAARCRRQTLEIRLYRRSMTRHQHMSGFLASTRVAGSTSFPPAQRGSHHPRRRVRDRYSRGRPHVQTLSTSRSIGPTDLQHLR